MTRAALSWAREACGGRVVSCLEGGYDLSTLGATVGAHVRALAED
jgi:acetoin utilization deacetylase AcuC-like enzyme